MTEPSSEATLRVSSRQQEGGVRALEIEVAAERVEAAFARAYRDLARRVQVRGFRPGKAPRSVLERLYGRAVAEEIERRLVSETLREAIERAGLTPVSEPTVEAPLPAAGSAFRYTARVEVKPEIPVPDLEGLVVRRPPVEVSDEEVERQLEALRERHAVLTEEPEGTAAARGHILTVDFEGRIDGEPFEGSEGRGVEVELGSDRFLPGFEEQLEGARAGEEREVRARFPQDHPNAELAGREAVFQVRVTAVRRRELPELDDEFAKDLGDFESLEALRERIRADLRAAREREARAAERRSLLDALLERVSFEVPPGLVERRLRRRLALAERDLRERVPPAALQAQLARWEQEWRPLAEREIREEWLLEAIAQAKGIQVEDAELDQRLEELARESGTSPARLRRAYRESGALEGLRAQMLEDKTVEFLLGLAKVEEATGP